MTPKILIFGQNQISEFLHTALSDKGYETIDFTRQDKTINKSEIASYEAIIDTYNTTDQENQSKAFVHNTTEIKSLLDLSSRLSCPFLFIYKDTANIQSDSSILSAIEFIDKYPKTTSGGQIKILLEDVYGPDINTSEKLQSFIQSMIRGDTLVVDNDEQEHFLLHQKDFIDGITNTINTFKTKKISDTYTFFPESPITEIELAHFLIEMSELPLDIEFTNPDETQEHSSLLDSETETNYPGIWHPQVSLESGLTSLLKFFDIPVLAEMQTELDLENDRYSKELISDDNPDVSPASSSLDSEYANNSDDSYADTLTGGNSYQKYDDHNMDIDNYVPMDSYKTSSQDSYGYNTMSTAIKLAILLLAILAIPTLIFVKNIAFGTSSLSKAQKNLQNLELAEAQKNSEEASKYFDRIEKIPLPVKTAARFLGVKEGDLTLALNTVDKTANTITYLVYAESQNNSKVLGTSTDKTETYLNEALELIDEIETSSTAFENKNQILNEQVKNYTEPITDYKEYLAKLKLISKSLPIILGSEQEQKYLLLINDSNEITPMGGNIEAYGIMTASNGNFEVENIMPTESINKLTGIQEIEPEEIDPEELDPEEKTDSQAGEEEKESATDEAEFSITDENGIVHLNMQVFGYHPDFPTNSWEIINAYSKATNEKVDGVISINSGFIKDSLNETGPINIPVYKGEFTAEDYNSILVSNQLEKDRYKELLIAVAKESINQTIGPNADPENLLKYLSDELNQKNIIIYHTNGAVLSNLISNNWAGSVANHTDDYLYVIDSNSSAMKNNTDITRSIKYMGTHPGDGPYTRRVAVTYTHNGLNQPNNSYLNSVSIIVPKEAALNSAYLLSGENRKQITKSIEVDSLGPKVSYNTDLLIDPEETITLVVEFESPKKTFEDETIDLYIQKQPGMFDSPVEVDFNYPLGIPNKIKLPDNARMSDSDVIYSETGESDQEYRFTL